MGHFNVAILTISDSAFTGNREDVSGSVLSAALSPMDFCQVHYEIVPDEKKIISDKLFALSSNQNIDLILTTGGTGLGPRDVTPEATMAVIEIEVPGITELMRSETRSKTPFAPLSRAVAGITQGCLIINLPGSPKGVSECMDAVSSIIPHALGIIKGSDGHSQC